MTSYQWLESLLLCQPFYFWSLRLMLHMQHYQRSPQQQPQQYHGPWNERTVHQIIHQQQLCRRHFEKIMCSKLLGTEVSLLRALCWMQKFLWHKWTSDTSQDQKRKSLKSQYYDQQIHSVTQCWRKCLQWRGQCENTPSGISLQEVLFCINFSENMFYALYILSKVGSRVLFYLSILSCQAIQAEMMPCRGNLIPEKRGSK